jgi:ubiquinone/menaquinone biosynthesis C-methylase UbiE
MTSAFDAVASDFERFRLLPGGVPEAIRSAIWAAVPVPSPAKVLDLGAGTGRFGKAFIEAGDSYTAVDSSLAMLREFQARTKGGLLVQADGRQLPFRNGSFDIVLLMHVLSAAGEWSPVIDEVRRVCHSGGFVAIGRTVNPEFGIDAQLKRQLKLILGEMGIPWHRPQKAHREALGSLELFTARHVNCRAASWSVQAKAQDFLRRHRSGARFAALPETVQKKSLQELEAWAKKAFDSVDKEFNEERSFELDIFEL